MRNNLWYRMSLILLSSLLMVASSVAQGIGDRNRPSSGGSHIISGKIRLPNGKPAAGARVTLGGADFTNINTVSDADGAFTFPGVPGGNYTVTVRAAGFEPESEVITIERFAAAGQGYQLAFHLKESGPALLPTSTVANPMLKGVAKEAITKYEKAMERIAAADQKGAVPLFDEAIAADPGFTLAYYERGSTLLKLGSIDLAIQSFVKAIELKPDYVEAKYGYGFAMYQKKDHAVAEAVFRDVLKQRPDLPEARLYLGISLFYLKDNASAERELSAVTMAKGGEKLALAYLYLGQIYSQAKKNADAIKALEKYLELLPNAPNAERVRTAVADLKLKSQ